jgi:molecular chaperone GrpE
MSEPEQQHPHELLQAEAAAMEQAAAAGAASPVLEAQLAQVQAKVAEYHDAFMRAKAEAENIRRRAAEDVSKAHKFGIESFAESLVPVKDSLEMALADQTADAAKLKEGVQATLRQLHSAFEKNGLKEIAPAPGDKFDPHQHQAISMMASAQPAQTVVNTLQKGYLIAERVLRPALVTVSNGQAAEPAQPAAPAA